MVSANLLDRALRYELEEMMELLELNAAEAISASQSSELLDWVAASASARASVMALTSASALDEESRAVKWEVRSLQEPAC